jgi:hypothetical protein
MMPRTGSSLLLAAFIAAVGGCDARVDPIVHVPVAVPGCPLAPDSSPWYYASEPADRLITDFESGNDLERVAGRDGYWVIGTDNTSLYFLAETADECSVRGGHAGHFSGFGFTNWWANWSAIFRVPTALNRAVPYDGRAYGGISFWAAFGKDNPADFAVPVGLATMDTAWNGSICTSTTTCADHYLFKVQLTKNWQHFDVRFTDMKQGGWGDPQVDMNREKMVGFVIWPRQAFDIWIDDIRFEP